MTVVGALSAFSGDELDKYFLRPAFDCEKQELFFSESTMPMENGPMIVFPNARTCATACHGVDLVPATATTWHFPTAGPR